MDKIVLLTPAMRRKARREALKRHKFKRKHAPDIKAVKKNKALQNEVTGILGELAVGKCFKMEPDFELYKRTGGFDWDFKYRGYKADVKTTANPNAELLILFPEEVDKDVDVFIAVSILKNKAHIRGYATRKEMAKIETRLFKYGPRKIKRLNTLKPFARLLRST